MIVAALAAALTGTLLCALGLGRAGGAIRFIPYPVIGGFLGATGWMLVSGAVRVVTDHGLGLSSIGTLLEPSNIAKLPPAIAIALAFHLAYRARAGSPYVIPAIMLAGIAVAHLVTALARMSPADAQTTGWMFTAPAAVGLTPSWTYGNLSLFPWKVLPPLAGDLFAVVFVTGISTLLNTTGLEYMTKREADLQRELKTAGIANLAAGLLGGFVSTLTMNRTALNYFAGARARLSGLIVAASSALMLMADPAFLAYVPKFVLGGLLLYLGAGLVHEWLVKSIERTSRLEYASLVAIALLNIYWGFIAGVLIGVIIGCATFAVSASRVNAIKFSFDGSEYRSALDRGPEELKILAAHGREIQGISLQSYLFFGYANRLYQRVKALLAQQPHCRFLLFDFRLVTGIDSSALHGFTQIKQAADEVGARLVLVSLPDEINHTFRTRGLLSHDVPVAPDLDRALEACEEAVISAHAAERGKTRGLSEWLTVALGNADYANQVAQSCERLEVDKDTIIASQGDLADSMHFILEGRIGVMVETEDGRSIRVRSLGPHTTIGEMGLMTRQLRSATIKAEAPSVLYALSADAYERLMAENAALGQALLAYVNGVLAERLSFASKAIGVLQR